MLSERYYISIFLNSLAIALQFILSTTEGNVTRKFPIALAAETKLLRMTLWAQESTIVLVLPCRFGDGNPRIYTLLLPHPACLAAARACHFFSSSFFHLSAPQSLVDYLYIGLPAMVELFPFFESLVYDEPTASL